LMIHIMANLEGMKAGLSLLKDLPAKRKLYVTPGLVDQGDLAAKVHNELGRLIATSSVDVVVLMDNSVTKYIIEGLKAGNYKGETLVEEDPLAYYQIWINL